MDLSTHKVNVFEYFRFEAKCIHHATMCALCDLTVCHTTWVWETERGRVDSVRDKKKQTTSNSSSSINFFFLKLMLIIFNMPECKISDEISTESCNHFYEYSWKCLHHVIFEKWIKKKKTKAGKKLTLCETVTNHCHHYHHHRFHRIVKRQCKKHTVLK